MAADPRFEQRVHRDLHGWLDAAVGPHPNWADAPAARRILEHGGAGDASPRRFPRSTLLLAAAVALGTTIGALVVGGGFHGDDRPTSTNPLGVIASEAPVPTGPSPSPSSVAIVATTPTPSTSSTSCATSWSSTGTKSPKGLTDGIRIDDLGSDAGGPLMLSFGHPLDTVQRVSIAPADPPFVNGKGDKVTVAGEAFFKLSLRGLTKPTTIAPADMVADRPVGRFTRTVASPIVEMRRVLTPRSRLPVDGPGAGSNEVWIIGLEHPACLRVRTARVGLIGADDPGDNTLLVNFDPAPSPAG